MHSITKMVINIKSANNKRFYMIYLTMREIPAHSTFYFDAIPAELKPLNLPLKDLRDENNRSPLYYQNNV